MALVVLLLEAVHPHHDALARFDVALVFVRRVLDFVLDVAGLDGAQRAAHLVDALQVFVHAALDGIGEGFDVLAAADRIDRVGDAGFVAR